MKLGEKIKLLRGEMDLTQPELAASAGIEQSYLSKLENEKGSPSFDIIQRIATALNLSGMELINSLDAFYVQEKLSHIPEIAAKFAEQRMIREKFQKRKFFYASLMMAFGILLFVAGHMKLLISEISYQYISDGEIKPTETVYQFKNHRITEIGETSTEKDQRLRQNKQRLDAEYLVTNDYQGEMFIKNLGENRRVFQLNSQREINQPANSIAYAMGVTLIFIGAILFFFTLRFRS